MRSISRSKKATAEFCQDRIHRTQWFSRLGARKDSRSAAAAPPLLPPPHGRQRSRGGGWGGGRAAGWPPACAETAPFWVPACWAGAGRKQARASVRVGQRERDRERERRAYTERRTRSGGSWGGGRAAGWPPVRAQAKPRHFGSRPRWAGAGRKLVGASAAREAEGEREREREKGRERERGVRAGAKR